MRATTKVSLSALLTLALATPALAQDDRRPTGSGSSTGGSATARGGSSSGGSSGGSSSTSSGGSMSSGSGSSSTGRTAVARPSREPQSSARRPSSGTASGGGPVIPAYSRPRGNNAVRGEAIDRGNNPLPPRDGYYFPNYSYYNSYYGYGSPYRFWGTPIYTGFGYFYYDPYWGYYDPFYSRGYYAYGPSGTRYKDKDDRDYNIGSLRLKINVAHAEVYVDGLYRGVVDDFDGLLQRLKLEAGAHRLEVRAPGFQTLVFDVLVTPGETTTYRGELKKQ